VREAGGAVRPAYPNPEETSMKNLINEGGVRTVTTGTTGGPDDTCHLVSVFIHHELTPEKIAQLCELIEMMALKAVKTWASL
jgi:hypothetical protein